MVRRILRSMFAVGLFDNTAAPADVDGTKIDYGAHAADVRKVAEQSIVVLRNERNLLPLPKDLKLIAVIGGYADLGVMSGGGSSQVTAYGTPARLVPMGGEGLMSAWRNLVLHPSPPIAAIRALAPGAEMRFVDSRYPSAAPAAAADADVAIVFATQWMLEHYDAPDLSLPSGQDDVIRAVAKANRNAAREAADRPVPRHVRAEFDAYLRCGRFEHGFLRVKCEQCHAEKLVAFSRKGRTALPLREPPSGGRGAARDH